MKRIKSAVFVLLVICLALGLAGCSGTNEKKVKADPTKQVISSVVNTIDMLEESSTPWDLLFKAFENGSIVLDYNAAEQCRLYNILYRNAASGQMANEYYYEEKARFVDLNLYSNGSELAVKSERLFDNEVYGVKLDSFKADLQTSDILEVAGMSYDEYMSEHGDEIDKVLNLSKPVDLSKEEEELKVLSSVLVKALNSVNVVVEENNVDFDGKKVKSIDVTYTLSKEKMDMIVEAIQKWSDSCKTGAFKLLSSVLDSYFVNMNMQDKSSTDAVNDYKISFSINPKKKTIMRASLESFHSLNSAAKESYVLILGENPVKSDEWNALHTVKTEARFQKTELVYHRVNTKDVFKREFTQITSVDQTKETQSFLFEYNQKENTVKFERTDNDNKTSYSGTLSYSDQEFKMSLKENIKSDQSAGSEVSIVAKVGGNVPDVPSYVNIVTMPSSKIESLEAHLSEEKMKWEEHSSLD